jgi:transposase
VHNVQLSREAKHRLRVITYYLQCGKASLTCRHFGIVRSYLYKWLKRYDPRNLRSLENLSRRPHRMRRVTYDQGFVSTVRKLRTDYPRYSAAKLAVILKRDFDTSYSAATVGRVIRRFGLYFSRVIRRQRARKASVRAWIKRKPYELKATKPHQVIEFDMKHIRFEDRKWYAFVAVDILTKEAVIHGRYQFVIPTGQAGPATSSEAFWQEYLCRQRQWK